MGIFLDIIENAVPHMGKFIRAENDDVDGKWFNKSAHVSPNDERAFENQDDFLMTMTKIGDKNTNEH